MNKTIFACDIDNTLIYSKKHPHDGWPCVEWIHENEQAYMSPLTCELLSRLGEEILFLPVTSRSAEQYSRIRWPEGIHPRHVITTHGAKLFTDNQEDESWKKETDRLLSPWADELRRMETLLSPDPSFIRCKTVDNAYLFVYCAAGIDPAAICGRLRGMTPLSICAGGKKIYLLPPGLNKGTAIERLRRRFPQHRIIAAGDSEMDLDMLNSADYTLFPQGIASQVHVPGSCCPQNALLSEFVAEQVLTMV